MLCLAVGCKTKPEDTPPEGEGTYFSIRQFAMDQWHSFKGQPYSMFKIVTINGKSDTTMTNAYYLDWGSILKVFFETDISDKKYFGLYDFSQFEDATTYTNNYYYEAKDPKLFTQKLQISADNEHNKIKTIYIETQKSGGMSTTTKKLYYSPMNVIQIQEFEKTKGGPEKEIKIEYRFQI